MSVFPSPSHGYVALVAVEIQAAVCVEAELRLLADFVGVYAMGLGYPIVSFHGEADDTFRSADLGYLNLPIDLDTLTQLIRDSESD